MPSQALTSFVERLKEVQQLLDAHAALVGFKKAQDAHKMAAGDMSKIGDIIKPLVSSPSVGRPPQVQALNSAAIALLSGHLQGFITDLYEESATHLLGSHVSNIQALVKAAPTRGNPNRDNINTLFSTLGFAGILDGISWKKMSNESLKSNLRAFNELRNRIVHGKSEVVRKKQVATYLSIWTNLAKQMDQALAREIKARTGKSPW